MRTQQTRLGVRDPNPAGLPSTAAWTTLRAGLAQRVDAEVGLGQALMRKSASVRSSSSVAASAANARGCVPARRSCRNRAALAGGAPRARWRGDRRRPSPAR